MPDNPYVGPTAFTENDSARFFGRAEETRELASLVIARRAVLLYAQSGSGKTSLLQASLIPELKRRKRVETFPIARVMGSADPSSGNLYVENALANLFPDPRGKTFCEAFGAVLSSDAKGRRTPHLVIFDQFEEIFTFHPELTDRRKAFFEQLGECLSAYPQLSLLLSMREDYLADLEANVALLPDRMRTRMRLERLGVENSLEAIREPAAAAGMPFAAGAAEQLVDNLRRIRTGAAGANGFALGLYVESVQLQIVCRQLWSRLTEDTSRKKAEIDSDDIAKYANVDDALIQFYRDSLAKAQQAGVTERALRRWFGERLITPAGTRGLVYRGERETEGLPNTAVDILRDCYIIRADLRGGNTWYELAHDRLVEPVREDNLVWKASYRNPVAEALERGADNLLTGSGLVGALRFAKENAQELTPEERLFLKKSEEEEKKAKARRRTAIGIAAAVILVLSAVTIWALNKKAEATASEAKARDSEMQAKASEAKARDAAAVAAASETEAKAAEKQATLSADLALARQLATESVAQLPARPDSYILATLLALESMKRRPLLENHAALRQATALTVRKVYSFAHGDIVRAVAFSPDGKWMATGSDDRTARIMEAATGRKVASVKHDGAVYAVAFSPDSKLLATASGDAKAGMARVIDVGTRREVWHLDHKRAVKAVVFSQDGKWVATGSDDSTARVLNAATGEEWARLDHKDVVNVVAFSRDSKWVATGSGEADARVLEVATRTQKAIIEHGGNVLAVAYSPNGKWLATGSWDRNARLIDAATGREITRIAHEGPVTAVAFSPDSKWLATGSDDKTARLIDAATGKEMVRVAHEDAVTALAFSPDSKWLATGSNDRTARVIDAMAGREIARVAHEGPVRAVAFSPDGKWLATGSNDNQARVMEAETEAAKHVVHLGGVVQFALSPGGQWVAAEWPRTRGRVIEVSTRKDAALSINHYFKWEAAAFSRDGKWLATASDDKTMVTPVDKGRPATEFSHDSSVSHVTAVALSRDGRLVATGIFERAPNRGRVQIMEVASHKEVLGTLHDGPVRALAFSPDGKWVAAAGEDKTVKIMDAASGKDLVAFESSPHESAVRALAFSPDGSRVATGSEDKTACLWDAASGKLSVCLAHQDAVYAVAFSPDGKWLATGSKDKTARVMEAATGEELVRHQMNGPVEAVCFSGKSALLVAARPSDTGKDPLLDISGLELDANQLIRDACAGLPRNLTREEWARYLPGETYRATCDNLPEAPKIK